MRAYLVQHGKAHPKEVDPERRLTDEGKAETETVAVALGAKGLAPGSVWHSGKARAQQTAEILGAAGGSGATIIRHDNLAPNDPVAPIEAALTRATEDVMIVGHLPHLAKLAGALLAHDERARPVVFANSGVVCLTRADEGIWAVVWLLVPQLV